MEAALFLSLIIIIMYIYHALINAPRAHMIHINLNIFYTHVEHSPAKTIYIKYYTTTKNEQKNALQTRAQTHTHKMTVAETGY